MPKIASHDTGFKGRFPDAPESLDGSDVRNRRFVTNAEVAEQLAAGGVVKGIIIEASQAAGSDSSLYLLYMACSWGNRGYRIFRVFRGGRPRFFRDLDRLVRLVRDEFDYHGPITLRTSNRDRAPSTRA